AATQGRSTLPPGSEDSTRGFTEDHPQGVPERSPAQTPVSAIRHRGGGPPHRRELVSATGVLRNPFIGWDSVKPRVERPGLLRRGETGRPRNPGEGWSGLGCCAFEGPSGRATRGKRVACSPLPSALPGLISPPAARC